MQYYPRRILTAILLWSALFSVSALSLESMEDYTSYVLQKDISYSRVILEIQDAQNGLNQSLLEASKISVDSGYTYTGTGNSWKGSLSASVPLSPALGLSGSISSNSDFGYDLSGSVGLSFTPFTHSVSEDLAQNSYEKSIAEKQEIHSSVSITALKQLLTYREAQRSYALATEAASVNEQKYLDEKVRYELGKSSLDEVRTLLLSWSAANRQTLAAHTALQQAEQQMYLLLGEEVQTFILPDPDADQLHQMIAAIQDSGLLEKVTPVNAYSLQSAQYDAQKARITYEDIREYDPNLKISTTLAYNKTSIGASVSFSLSPQDFNKQEKEYAFDQMSLADRTVEQQYRNTLFAIENLKSSLATSAAQLEIVTLEIEQAQSLYEVSLLLYEGGSLSATELEQSRNDLRLSEHQLYSTLVDRYVTAVQLLGYAL